jgi:hypothetical protein
MINPPKSQLVDSTVQNTHSRKKIGASMTRTIRIQNGKLLDSIREACLEIQQALTQHLETTTNVQYKADIEKDMVTLENLKLIIFAVKDDIEKEKAGASTELLLRIASNDFKNKLALIPEKKPLRKEIIKALKEIHRNILQLTICESAWNSDPSAASC